MFGGVQIRLLAFRDKDNGAETLVFATHGFIKKVDKVPANDSFVRNLRLMLAPAFHRTTHEIAIVKTVASQKEGVKELFEKIRAHQQLVRTNDKKYGLLAEKAYHLIQQRRMKDVDKSELKKQLEATSDTNLYQFIKRYLA